MKNLFKLTLITSLTLSVSLLSMSNAFASTTNSKTKAPSDPIKITSYDQLKKIGVDQSYPANGSYVLENNIELPKTKPPLCAIPNGFSGTLDGQEHAISCGGLIRPISAEIQDPKTHETVSVAGLFAYLHNATITNLCIKDYAFSNIPEPAAKRQRLYAGTLTGLSVGSTINNVVVGDTFIEILPVPGQTSFFVLGGIIGMAYDTTFNNCAALAVYETSSPLHSSFDLSSYMGELTMLGGIVGWANSSTLDYCSVTDTEKAVFAMRIGDDFSCNKCCLGGLVGYMINGQISHSWIKLDNISSHLSLRPIPSTNPYVPVQALGGLIGCIGNGTTTCKVENCYVRLPADIPPGTIFYSHVGYNPTTKASPAASLFIGAMYGDIKNVAIRNSYASGLIVKKNTIPPYKETHNLDPGTGIIGRIHLSLESGMSINHTYWDTTTSKIKDAPPHLFHYGWGYPNRKPSIRL